MQHVSRRPMSRNPVLPRIHRRAFLQGSGATLLAVFVRPSVNTHTLANWLAQPSYSGYGDAPYDTGVYPAIDPKTVFLPLAARK